MIRFTIPEGYTVDQIADKLANEQTMWKKRLFLKMADTTAGLKMGKLFATIPENTSICTIVWKGYIFPETYEFKKDSTAGTRFIQRMLQELDRSCDTLPEAGRIAQGSGN